MVEFAAELIRAFLDEAADLLVLIREAAASGDRGSIRRASHSLKSNARDFGAVDLGQLCEAVERDLRAEAAMPDMAQRVAAILAAWPAVEEALLHEVEGLAARS